MQKSFFRAKQPGPCRAQKKESDASDAWPAPAQKKVRRKRYAWPGT